MKLSKSKLSKHQRHLTLLRNLKKRDLSEQDAIDDLKRNGLEPIRTGIGSDFKTDIKEKQGLEYWEVKAGNGTQSRTQKAKERQVKREGNEYNIYRVSNQRLEFLAQEQALKDLHAAPSTTGIFDPATFHGRLIIADPADCPHCDKISSGTVKIFEEFGFRNMGDGTVRVQSWCRDCRHESRNKNKLKEYWQ